MTQLSMFDKEEGERDAKSGHYCPKCGSAWIVHEDDGSCVEDTPAPAPVQKREKSPAHARIEESFTPEQYLPLVCPKCGTEAVEEFEGEACGVCGGMFERRPTI